MGILTTEEQNYYSDSGPHGNYRFISLTEIIDSFNATYVGKNKICENVNLNDITFHAIRGLQELSYDTIRFTKDWEVVIPSTLVLVMPIDYVNYVKLAWADESGVERIIYPTSNSSNPRDITPTVNDSGGFTTAENTDLAFDEESTISTSYKSQQSSDIGDTDAEEIDEQYGELVGGRYGIDPQHAQINGTFYVDEDAGKFHFSSTLAGKNLVLKYISDGIASVNNNGNITLDLNNSLVPKFAEEAIYKHILYGVLLARKDTDQGLLMQIKKERFAETRKAKIRLSNIKTNEIVQVLRGSSKIIKH